jgi:UDP-glucose 4-epimerase
MKVLILGSKGFIGQNLLNYLADNNYEVWGADVVTDYVNKGTYFLIDATNSDFSFVFQNVKYDFCINCSGASSVPESMTNPMRDYFLNTVNVFKILEAIKKFQPTCRFLNLSSAAVYGNPQILPVKETASPNPLSPYGIHKLQAEQLCKEFYDFYGIKTCSLRIFSVYGNGLQKQLFWDLFWKAKTGHPFKLYGTGNESRDFIHISDLLKAIDLITKFCPFASDVINVGNGQEIMIKNAVSTFFSFFNSEIAYTFSGDSREGDPINWKADISTLISYGYNPSIDINAGLKSYYKWISLNKHD